jgi:hypothetical protein
MKSYDLKTWQLWLIAVCIIVALVAVSLGLWVLLQNPSGPKWLKWGLIALVVVVSLVSQADTRGRAKRSVPSRREKEEGLGGGTQTELGTGRGRRGSDFAADPYRHPSDGPFSGLIWLRVLLFTIFLVAALFGAVPWH